MERNRNRSDISNYYFDKNYKIGQVLEDSSKITAILKDRKGNITAIGCDYGPEALERARKAEADYFRAVREEYNRPKPQLPNINNLIFDSLD